MSALQTDVGQDWTWAVATYHPDEPDTPTRIIPRDSKGAAERWVQYHDEHPPSFGTRYIERVVLVRVRQVEEAP